MAIADCCCVERRGRQRSEGQGRTAGVTSGEHRSAAAAARQSFEMELQLLLHS